MALLPRMLGIEYVLRVFAMSSVALPDQYEDDENNASSVHNLSKL
jgi:hypothetical protein